MSEKRRIRNFVKELDACLESGKVPPSADRSKECTDMLELGVALSGAVRTGGSHKDAVRQRVLKAAQPGSTSLRRTPRWRLVRTGAIAATSCLLAVLLLAPTSFAGDWMRSVVHTISLGHITVSQMEETRPETMPFPAELKGKIFTKDGKLVEEWAGHEKPFYTAEGEEIAGVTNGEIITRKQMEAEPAPEIIRIEDASVIPEYTAFKAGLPAYVPEGFVFDRAEVYKKGDKYLDVYYLNPATGKTIHIQERLADEETAYAMSTEHKVEQVRVSGVDAVIIGGKTIDWEKDGVLYSIMTGKSGVKLDNSQLIRMAESIEPISAK
ncbi:DUF4367 domain-containing protein [Paenibacillus mesotrionivorans]|uniref:DUF4367 domain-containing protein n=1 Tax=Paenibacillus mesotrionivorans TaxID=3160968 RepID=A0ACC7P5E4_9BACL